MSLLEDLLLSRDHVAASVAVALVNRDELDPYHDYYFSSWQSCTCGHVYRAATGELAPDHVPPRDADRRFVAVLRAILEASPIGAAALAAAGGGDEDLPEAVAVSNIVSASVSERDYETPNGLRPDAFRHARWEARRRRDEKRRLYTLDLLDAAIANERAKDEAARLAVLAAAAEREPVPA